MVTSDEKRPIGGWAKRFFVAALVAAAVPLASTAQAAWSYTPQDCGTQNILTATQRTSLTITGITNTGCGMKAAIWCHFSDGTGDTGLLLGGLTKVVNGQSTKPCPSGKVGYLWGHQEGVNW